MPPIPASDLPPRPPIDQAITFLYAEDPGPSRHFYAEVLGLPLVLDQGGCAIFAVAAARSFLGVCQARGPREVTDPRRQGGCVLTLVSREVAAWHRRLIAAGTPVEGTPALHEGLGIRHFFFRDPAGYLLEIQHFKRPGWPTADAWVAG